MRSPNYNLVVSVGSLLGVVGCLLGAKLWNQVPSLDHFAVQNSGDFLCWKYKEVVCCYVSNLRQFSELCTDSQYSFQKLTIVSRLKHKNTQPLNIFNRVRVLHLDRLKEGTWLHSFASTALTMMLPRNYRETLPTFPKNQGIFAILML